MNHQVQNFKEIKNKIDSIDFSRVIEKMVKHLGWLREDANKTCQYYRNYLFLNIKYGQEYKFIPPSEDIDEFWHNHILDTESYAQDCQKIFGEFFHHYPYFGIDGKTDFKCLYDAFEQTQKLHFQEFGEKIVPTKSKFPPFLYRILKKFEK